MNNQDLDQSMELAYLRWKKAESTAEQRQPLQPQREIEWGSHWMIGTDDPAFQVVWGYVLRPEDLFSARLAWRQSPGEIREYLDNVKRRHERGWRLGLEWTCKHPQMVSRHITELWPILPVEFNEAKRADFRTERISKTGWFAMMAHRISAQMSRARGASAND